jgi:hypothetical protein
MRRISLNRRLSQDEAHDDDVELVLIKISHPDLDEPILLSSDPTERVSIEPVIYGTYSTWNNTSGNPFYFLMMDAAMPGDQDDAPASATIVVQAITSKIAELLRSTREQATVDMAVVIASDTANVQAEQRGLKLVNAGGNASEITLDVTRDPITSEPWPVGRMTRQRFPGMHK